MGVFTIFKLYKWYQIVWTYYLEAFLLQKACRLEFETIGILKSRKLFSQNAQSLMFGRVIIMLVVFDIFILWKEPYFLFFLVFPFRY